MTDTRHSGRVVLCHGCFDVLHVGHVRHLLQARSFGDRLIVSVTSDRYVNKGPHRPVNTLADRIEVLRSLHCIDRVVPSDSESSVMNLLDLHPDIYCKGIDYAQRGVCEAELNACHELGIAIRYTTTDKLSATDIIKKVVAA